MARLQVKELAEARGLNISQLLLQANRLTPSAKLSYPTVHALWHNRTQRPDLATLSAIARALRVKPGDLIVEDEADEISIRMLAADEEPSPTAGRQWK
jgi:DNA-binding Xre family transcriptional regulator